MKQLIQNLPHEEAQKSIIKTLTSASKKDRQLVWMLSGGSNIKLATEIANELPDEVADCVTVTLIDERYGLVGHPDSNWQQLVAVGFPFDRFQTIPVILDKKTASQCARLFAKSLQELIRDNAYLIGMLGIGTDGHTAGILPNRKAIESSELALYYKGPDYERITITPSFFPYLDEAIVVAQGTAKAEQLNRLEQELPSAEQPAQLVKQAKRAVVYYIK